MEKFSKDDLWKQVASFAGPDPTKNEPEIDYDADPRGCNHEDDIDYDEDPPGWNQKGESLTDDQCHEEDDPENDSEESTFPPPEKNGPPAIQEVVHGMDSDMVEMVPPEKGEIDPQNEKSIALQDQQDFYLDQAEKLSPELFPHQPVGDSRIIPLTIPNLQFLLKSYGIRAEYNVIKKEPEIFVPGLVSSPDNAVQARMVQIKSLARQNGMSITGLEDIVLTLADRNQYNPVGTWIKSKPWDGVDRIPEFCNTLTVREDIPNWFRDILLKRWMISCVAAVFEPAGFRSRGVLTFQGPQGIGKTSWIGALVPDQALRESVIKLDHHLDAGNKDSQIAAATHWIVEIGELESSFRRDVARLKGFITNDCDKVRLPYARAISTFPRRTVFAATVNDSQFLVDSTGNTRWWVIPVTHIDYAHNLDMQQVWAQFTVEYEKGEQWWLTREEEDLLEACNKDYRVVSAIEEQVIAALDLSRKDEDGLPAMTATEFLEKIGLRYVKNSQAKECGKVFREYLGEPKKINGFMKWRIPFAKNPDKYDL